MAKKTALGVGIVGCGNISTIYMLNMGRFTGLNLVACADMREDVARAQAAAHHIEARSIDALMTSGDIDIIVNLTTPNAHFPVSLAALKAGKHVFSEKPVTVEAAHAARLVTEARACGVKLGCAPDTFLGAGGRLAREILDGGKVGKILSGTCFLMSHGMEHWHPDPTFFFKPGGGPILDMAPYYLGALVNLIGPIDSVEAVTLKGFARRTITSKGPMNGKTIAVGTPTTAQALIRFNSGAEIVFVMSWDVWKHGHPPIELYGTEGSLRIPDPNFFGGTVEYTEKSGDWISVAADDKPFGKPNWTSPNWPPGTPPRANYRCLGVAELASAVLNKTPHRASGALASHVLEAMHAILNAGKTGKRVKVKSRIARPVALKDEDAEKLWAGGE